MDIMKIIQNRRTARVPFDNENAEVELEYLLRLANVSPSGAEIGWKLITVRDEETKKRIADLVDEDFFTVYQKNAQKFRSVFSVYPQWLRFTGKEAREKGDGILLRRTPFFMKYAYRLLLGGKMGPLSGRLGIMNEESRLFRKNLLSGGILIGVFQRKNTHDSDPMAMIDTGAMLQNLRLYATSMGLAYQDQGWITATGIQREKVREILNGSDDYQAVNFFRIGKADEGTVARQKKQSDHRRNLESIMHLNHFQGDRSDIDYEKMLAIFERKPGRNSISAMQMRLLVEAARWSPTGFNVQPFEYVFIDDAETMKKIGPQKGAPYNQLLLVIENHRRRDPDPGPCEILARGAVLQNIRLTAGSLNIRLNLIPFEKRARKEDHDSESRKIMNALGIPKNYTLLFILGLTPVS